MYFFDSMKAQVKTFYIKNNMSKNIMQDDFKNWVFLLSRMLFYGIHKLDLSKVCRQKFNLYNMLIRLTRWHIVAVFTC